MDLDIQVTKLKMQKSGFLSQHYALEDRLTTFYPEAIQEKTTLISALEADRKFLQEHPLPDAEHFSITVRGMGYTDKKEAGTALIKECGKLSCKNDKAEIGEYCGYSIQIRYDWLNNKFHAILKRQANHMAELSQDPIGTKERGNVSDGSVWKRWPCCIRSAPEPGRWISCNVYRCSVKSIVRTIPLKSAIVEFDNRFDEKLKLFDYIRSDLKGKNKDPGDAVAG